MWKSQDHFILFVHTLQQQHQDSVRHTVLYVNVSTTVSTFGPVENKLLKQFPPIG